MVQLVTIRIYRCDGDGAAKGFPPYPLRHAIEGGFERGLSAAVVRSSKVGDNEAHIVHLCDCYKQVRKRGRRHDTEVRAANWNCHRVLQVRRKLIEKDYEWLAIE